jgi:hypothetical protein
MSGFIIFSACVSSGGSDVRANGSSTAQRRTIPTGYEKPAAEAKGKGEEQKLQARQQESANGDVLQEACSQITRSRAGRQEVRSLVWCLMQHLLSCPTPLSAPAWLPARLSIFQCRAAGRGATRALTACRALCSRTGSGSSTPSCMMNSCLRRRRS